MSDAPTAKIVINGEVEERIVCSVNLRTRGDDNNTISLSGGVDIDVSNEFAAAVVGDYFESILEERDG
jgi:hypothetical protein